MTTSKFCPSNGTEGMYFQESFCFKCRFYDEEKGCPILNATMRISINRDEYPNQWVAEDGYKNPKCTAFEGTDGSHGAYRVLCKADRL
jgi:hypothetical protein